MIDLILWSGVAIAAVTWIASDITGADSYGQGKERKAAGKYRSTHL